MNVTREVVNDLWPAYAAGDARADTRALVEEFLRQDPEFAGQLQRCSDEHQLRHQIPKRSPLCEAQALQGTQRLLHGADGLRFLAILFSCFAFGRIVSDTSWEVSPRNFIVTSSIAGAFWVAYFTRLVWLQKSVCRGRA